MFLAKRWHNKGLALLEALDFHDIRISSSPQAKIPRFITVNGKVLVDLADELIKGNFGEAWEIAILSWKNAENRQ